jgi:hypothetical protein
LNQLYNIIGLNCLFLCFIFYIVNLIKKALFMKTKGLLTFAVLFFSYFIAQAQSSDSIVPKKTKDFNPQIGISLKGSTNGIGADVYFRPFKSIAIKAGYEVLDINLTSETVKPIVGDAASISIPMPTGGDMGFDLGAKFKTGALSLAIGYQPFGGLYLTAGISSFLLSAQAIGTPNTDLSLGSHTVPNVGTVSPTIAKDKIGVFSIDLNPTLKIAPYFGIGLGSFVPRKHLLSFAFEIGAYYMGAPQVSVNFPDGLKSSNINYGSTLTQAQINQYFSDVNNQIDGVFTDLKTQVNSSVSDINTKIKPFAFYPVLKLTIGIKAFEFKK